MIDQQDWRSACVLLANSHLQFVQIVMKLCPDNPAIQELGTELTERLGEVITTCVVEKAKQ